MSSSTGREYIKENLREMLSLGYSLKEAIKNLENDENVCFEDLEDVIREAESNAR